MKTRIYLFALMLLFSGMSVNSQAAEKSITKAQTEVRITEMKTRVDQIRAMDLSHLNKSERTGLKHELKDMKKELRSYDGVIYISAGALILIIILLILLL